MAKALCVISSTTAMGLGVTIVGYRVSIDTPSKNFASDYSVNTGLSIAQNLTNLKTKVVADCADQGVTLLTTDVIVFGGPS